MSESRTITLTDIGPTGKPIVITAKPGIGVLTGYCGVGKSICLEAISVALGNKDKGRVAPTNGKKRGTVECLGVVLSVSAGRITRTGDSEAASLEEFTLADLINPPVKDEAAKNRHGIKSLLRLTKEGADPSKFYHLAGDKKAFEKIISPDDVKSADLVEMAGKIKRGFEKASNAVEKQAEQEEAAAAADRDAMKDLQDGPDSGEALQAAYTTAVQQHAKLDTEWKAFWDGQEAADEARVKLTAATGSGSTIADLEVALQAATSDVNKASNVMIDLEKQLQAAKNAYTLAVVKQEAQNNALFLAKQNEKLTAGWQAAIDAVAGGVQPDEALLLEAETAMETARKAVEHGAVLRNAKERVKKAAEHQKKADEYRKEAHRLNLAAKGTDAVLSEAVASSRFSVDGTFLMGKLPTGDTKPFYDLSAGEKCMIATAEKIDRVCAVRANKDQLAIVDLDQSNFQEIPDSVRTSLDYYAKERNCFVSTGMVNDDPEIGFFMWGERANGKTE